MATRSDEPVAVALAVVVRDHGWGVAAHTKRLRAALTDVLGADADDHRGALDAVALAVEEGVVADLRAAGRERVDDVAPVLVDRMVEWGLDRDHAAWAVRAWAAQLPETTVPPQAATNEPPGTRSQAVEPTTLPPAATAPSTRLPSAVTVAPPPPPRAGSATPAAAQRGRTGRGVVIGAVAAALVLVAGGVAAAISWAGDDPGSGGGPDESASPSTTAAASAPPPAAEAGAVITATSLDVPANDRRMAMGSRTGGVRVASLGEVESAGTGDAERAAPEGGRLIGFRLADWPCESGSCRPWSRLGLAVVVDGARRPLRVSGSEDTFAVAVPSDATDVDLVMKADGVTQSLSLTTGEPARSNIEVLARTGRVDRIAKRFTLTERTSVPFNYGGTVTDTVQRAVAVTRAELMYFTDHGRPSSPGSAFLKVRAQYTIPIAPDARTTYAFDLREIAFVARGGKRYQARDLDPGPGLNAVFEVPADLRGGTFRLGGTYPTSSNGVSFTRTLATRTIPIRFD